MEIIKAKNINKTYGHGETAVHAVNDVSLSVKSGEFITIVGSSGSGKSTLLHILGGLDKPDSGSVTILDTDVYELKSDERAIFRRRNLGFIFQFFNLIPVLTVKENIELPLEIDNNKIDSEKIKELVKILNLEKRLKHFPNELSGGEQQRVAIARTLASNPSIILADEPTGNLDKKNTLEILNLLKLLCKKYGVTVVMITHDLSITTMADRIIRIEDGKVVERWNLILISLRGILLKTS